MSKETSTKKLDMKGISEKAFEDFMRKSIESDYFSRKKIKEIQDQLGNDLPDKAELKLFIDAWNTRGNYNVGDRVRDFLIVAKYDYENAPDKNSPFWINDLWLTYEEAMEVMLINDQFGIDGNDNGRYSRARTMFPRKSGALYGYAKNMIKLEVIRIMDYYIINNGSNPDTSEINVTSTRDFLWNTHYIERVIGKLKLSTTDDQKTHFYNISTTFSKLEEIWLGNIVYSFSFRAPKLKLECWEYMIEKAANTTDITISVHADTYAKLTGDITNDSAASLSEEELSQWEALVEKAASKNISFARI